MEGWGFLEPELSGPARQGLLLIAALPCGPRDGAGLLEPQGKAREETGGGQP